MSLERKMRRRTAKRPVIVVVDYGRNALGVYWRDRGRSEDHGPFTTMTICSADI
jgi:hypothetical protein